jgi:hypothetical protein
MRCKPRRTRPAAEADAELAAIEGSAIGQRRRRQRGDSLLQRRYVLPFLLACLTGLHQATGINSVLAYAVTILDQAGLSGSMGNIGDVALKLLNALMTVLAVVLVDRKGRKFLLMLGSGGIVVSLLAAALLFRSAESGQSDAGAALAQRIQPTRCNSMRRHCALAAQWRLPGSISPTVTAR